MITSTPQLNKDYPLTCDDLLDEETYEDNEGNIVQTFEIDDDNGLFGLYLYSNDTSLVGTICALQEDKKYTIDLSCWDKYTVASYRKYTGKITLDVE